MHEELERAFDNHAEMRVLHGLLRFSKPVGIYITRRLGYKSPYSVEQVARTAFRYQHTSTSKGKGPVQAVQNAPKKGKGKGKGKKVKPNKARTENRCFTCNEVGHWRQNCPKHHEAGMKLVPSFHSKLVRDNLSWWEPDKNILFLKEKNEIITKRKLNHKETTFKDLHRFERLEFIMLLYGADISEENFENLLNIYKQNIELDFNSTKALNSQYELNSRVGAVCMISHSISSLEDQSLIMSSEDGSDGSRLRMPRGLTLEQAKDWRRDRQIGELATRLDEVLRRLDRQGRPSKKRYESETETKSSSEESSPRFKPRRRKRDHSSSEEAPRPRRRDKRKDDDRKLRLDVPDFNGSMTDPEKYLEWVRRAETVFNFKGYDERKCCKIAECKLVGYASLWYDNLKKKRSKEGRSKIRTWEQLKRYMKKKFVPEDFIQDLFIKLQSFKQGTLSVEAYISEFEKLNMLCDLDEKSEQKMARFIAGLNEKIQEKVEIQPYWSFEELCKVALRIEKQEKNKKLSSYIKPTSKTYERPRFEKSTSNSPLKLDKVKTESKKEDIRKCFKCQGWGHISSNCPSKRVMTAQEVRALREAEEEELEEEINDEEEEDEHVSEVEPESAGQALVLRRSLHTKPMSMEETQREKIFLTRCKVNDRLCEMIIDTGSCTNVVATTLVEKLKHPTSLTRILISFIGLAIPVM
ncbi:hypothetical protein OSB04_021144 [Centaurea solstitialis]|uniref:CCHC-type domain-containing protein n=1 Tax=Centaurea solstitialis TaxID=347529 RepID=A0AA38WHI1_9ASTR|nr:hypothetical protein OSB04_021144 [Centaurea solstitialis]